jgi:hypothetical protein
MVDRQNLRPAAEAWTQLYEGRVVEELHLFHQAGGSSRKGNRYPIGIQS